MQHRTIGRFGCAIALVVALLLAVSAPAWGFTYEQAGTFAGSVEAPKEPGVFPEEVQLGGVSGLAVNVDGAGGVPAGTLYAASYLGGELWIARYQPTEAGMKFVGAWQVKASEGEYQQCGPGGPLCAPRAEGGSRTVDVDVDRATGNVYVLNGELLAPGSLLGSVFTPTGSSLITRFGEKAAGGKTTAETPSQIHDPLLPGSLAVDRAGQVYIFDDNDPNNSYHRLMVFRPQTPGDYEHYVYSGQSSDVGAGFLGVTEFPSRPVVDDAGNVYVAGEDYVEKYDPTQPAAPICGFTFAKGGITSMTVDPETGEPFFYTARDKKVHQLSACNEGAFSEIGQVAVAPERDNLTALALDPKRELPETRPPGILYGAAPSAQPGIGKGQPGRGSLGYIFAPAEENPPSVESESVSAVTATSAELHADINPGGFETRYVFQYVTNASFEGEGETFASAVEVPAGGAALGGGKDSLFASATLNGLNPSTAYRYRVIATSECVPSEPGKICEVAGEPEVFSTYAVSTEVLPDSRIYELVSPVEKDGGQVLPADPTVSSCGLIECKPGAAYQHFPMQSTPDGNAIVYEGTPFAEAGGAVIENEYLARRDPNTGWGTINLTPPLMQSKSGKGYKAFDPSLGTGLLEQGTPSLSPEAPLDYVNLYRQAALEPLSLSPLMKDAPPNRVSGEGAGRLKVTYAGGSTDLSHLFFEANDALTSETIDGGEGKNSLYEWAGGQLRSVNLAPGDTEAVVGAVFGSGRLLESGNPNGFARDFSHAISADGSRAFWSSEAGQVYVRINGTETRKVEDPGKFLTASADGSLVLLNDGCLYNVDGESCVDLTQGQGGFMGISGQSEDLSHIYVVASTVLTGEEENSEGDKAQATKPNLYAWINGNVSFIATLLPQDNGQLSGSWQSSPLVRTAQASPGGRFVAFLSKASLSGYDNVGPCFLSNAGVFVDSPCPEAFLYDTATGQLRCASCNPSGAKPLGWSVLRLIPGASESLPQPRYLTDTGRLYFDSQDSLVSGDTNGGVEDVYQFEVVGVGTCKRAEGCLSLISAGREAFDSNFLAIDQSGQNVFFTARDQLVPADMDRLVDLYDAREAGGFAFESQPPSFECKGEGCQPPPPMPPDSPPASSILPSSGNAAPGCKKGQVRRHGKCVKKPHHKKKAMKAKGGMSK
jgi:hypothetical protein